MKPETFTVERATWLRGTHESTLRNCDGHMCCLGFLGLACGYTPAEIQGRSDPSEFENRPTGQISFEQQTKDRFLWPQVLATVHEDAEGEVTGESSARTALCTRIIIVNDNELLSDKSREARLTELFSEAGIKVVFK